MLPIQRKISAYNHYKGNDIKYIVIHYVGATGTAKNNVDYFYGGDRQASAHYFVDDDSITMSVPDNYVAYAVGGAKWNDCSKTGGGKMYGKITNTNSLSIEMCDTKKDGKIQATDKTIANTVDLVVAKLIKYNLKPSAVYRHFDVNGKHCPAYMMDSKSWNAFLNKVKAILGEDVDLSEITMEKFLSQTGIKLAGEMHNHQ